MKFTLSWLREHLDTNADIEVIESTLNNIGLEVESIEDKKEELKPFTVAKVLSVSNHPDADRLKVCNLETIEGMATPEGLHPLQQAFLEEAALQCGICTPGFLVASKNLLDKEPNPSEGRIRHWLAGNLCRCTGYDKIVKAVQKASDKS